MNRSFLSVTTSLIIVNIVVFLVGLVARQPSIQGLPVPGADQTVPTLQIMGEYSWFTCFKEWELWRLISYQFLHIDFKHILFNMWALFFFGPVVEQIMGPRRFLAYYLSCGVAGALFYSLLAGLGIFSMFDTPQAVLDANDLVHQFTDYTGAIQPWELVPLIGASAAVYGVMVAAAFMFPNEQISLLFPPVTMTMRTFLLLVLIGYATVSILFNLSNAGGEAGHLGGIILGSIIMLIWKRRSGGYFR